MKVIQIVGNPKMTVERVSVLVGGGSLGLGREELPMKLMHDNQLDNSGMFFRLLGLMQSCRYLKRIPIS